MSGHIPGPYAVDPDTREGMRYNNHIVLAGDPNMRLAFMAHGGKHSFETWDATAMLLAAAPDLLESCINLLAASSYEELLACSDAARAAIAKATGKER